MAPGAPLTARARTDARDWLIEADEPLAGLQLRSGGELPGAVANPALLAVVRKARHYGLRLAQPLRAQDDKDKITAWVEVTPDEGGAGCTIEVTGWQITPLPEEPANELAERCTAIVRQVSELSARIGIAHELLAVECRAADLSGLCERMTAGVGQPWSDFLSLEGVENAQPRAWPVVNGARVSPEGSERTWRAHLIPVGAPEPGSAGFELHLVADQPLPEPVEPPSKPRVQGTFSTAIGREIAPVLRQPIARIIANAETIRTQLAGPLPEEYSNYAADIATAGEHLLALLDDLVALEVVEDEQFAPAPDHIDLADLARRASGILGVRARERGIEVEAPGESERAPAIGEFRRVLQVLLNLLGNAIRYSPEGSHVVLSVARVQARAQVSVASKGEGLSATQQARLFDKFERLGRQGDGGSGLGLYISRRLARAMSGDLTVESAPGEGARFTLNLPADEEA